MIDNRSQTMAFLRITVHTTNSSKRVDDSPILGLHLIEYNTTIMTQVELFAKQCQALL